MKSVARMALKEGMIIGEDVYSYQNVLVATENTKINNQIISKLARHSIMCVNIKEASDMSITKYERIALSQAYKNFEKTYTNSLKAFQYMIDDFLNNQTPINPSFLLQIHNTVREYANNDYQLLDMLYPLLPDEGSLTYAHCLHSALISNVFGTWLSLSEDELKILILCGFFYDIGKLKLPNSLVWKEELNNFECNWLKTHTTLGYDLLKYENLNDSIKNCTLFHHEYCDGSGYPEKRNETEIDCYSKYIAIVDAYTTMTSFNVHKNPPTPFQVIRNFEKQGFQKYDSSALLLILKKLAYNQIGKSIRLSNGTEGEVLFIDEERLSAPVIKVGEKRIQLKEHPDLEITAIL